MYDVSEAAMQRSTFSSSTLQLVKEIYINVTYVFMCFIPVQLS